ncbi:MAG: A24 family peptidase [Gammaproteobacteria bacterium]|nr:A24 family peptidase [Gammaproteobacteria bacterium]
MESFRYLSDNPVAFSIVCGILGLLIGSFLNVVIYRLPIMLERGWKEECEDFLAGDEDGKEQKISIPEKQARFDLSKPDSHCPNCKHSIRAWENIPVFSFLILGGKCRACKARISFRYPLVELLTGILSLTVALHFGFGEQAAAALVLTWSLIALSMIDYDTQLLPDVITLPLLWLGLILSLWAVFVDPATSIVGAVSGYLILWMVFQLFKLVTGKDGMGFGDFKLLAVLGAWLGWQLLPAIILLSSLAGAVIGVSLIVFKKHNKDKPIPYGPYLAIAGWLALMWGEQINDTYLRMIL